MIDSKTCQTKDLKSWNVRVIMSSTRFCLISAHVIMVAIKFTSLSLLTISLSKQFEPHDMFQRNMRGIRVSPRRTVSWGTARKNGRAKSKKEWLGSGGT